MADTCPCWSLNKHMAALLYGSQNGQSDKKM